MENPALTEKMNSFLALEQKKEQIDSQLQLMLDELRTLATKSTFKVDGQWYQVRVRKGLRYMCKLDGPPRGRPRKIPATPSPEDS